MKYFTIPELTASATAKKRKIDNTPSQKVKENLENLVNAVLDPLREAYGKPITVTSGYRSPELNKAVGGVANSHHLSGMAADISIGSKAENKKLFKLILSLNLPFTQLINESNYSWVHISYDPSNIKRQVLNL